MEHNHERTARSYLRMPRSLLTDPIYQRLSVEAKLAYMLLLDRQSLSAKNGWQDERGQVYLYYTVEELAGQLGCGRQKAGRVLRELEQFGLITRRRQGQGRPSRIYSTDLNRQPCDLQTNADCLSEDAAPEPLDVAERAPNNLKENNPTYTHPSSIQPIGRMGLSEREKIFHGLQEQLETGILCQDDPSAGELVEEILSLMTDTLCSTKPTVRINGEDLPRAVVERRLRSLDRFHIEYVILSMKRNPAPVRNIRQYMLTALYNAPNTINHYFQALVRADYPRTCQR